MIRLKLLIAGFYVEFFTIWRWCHCGRRSRGEAKLLSWMSKIVYVVNESLLEKEIDRKKESQMSLVAWHLKQFVFLGVQNTHRAPLLLYSSSCSITYLELVSLPPFLLLYPKNSCRVSPLSFFQLPTGLDRARPLPRQHNCVGVVVVRAHW